MKFKSKIVYIGDLAKELIHELNSLIIFNEDIADESLREISSLHTVSPIFERLEKGDFIYIGENSYEILAVGDVAQDTLSNIGHCTIKFDGEEHVNLPGEIQVRGELKDIDVGYEFYIK